jgi:WD40 repeat protein
MVRCVAWHPQRPLLAAAGGLSTIQLWELPEQGTELIASDTLHLPPYYGSLRDLTFTQDGAHLLALADRGLIEFRQEGTPSIRRPRAAVHEPLHTVSTPLFSPEEGRWHEGQLWFNNSRQWGVYDPRSRSLVRESPVDEHAYALHVSPQHQTLLRYRSNNSQGHRIEVRTLDGGLLTSIRDVPKGSQDFPPDHGFVMRLEDDGTTVTFGQAAQVFRVSVLDVNVRYTRAFDQGDVQLTSLNTPAGLAITVGGVRNTLRLWNTLTHASMIALEPWQLDGLSGYVTKAHLDSASRLALGTSKGEVRVYDLTSGLHLMRGTRHGEGVVNDLTFSPEGSLLASAAQDGTVRLWDVRTGEEMAAFTHPAGVYLVRFSPLANELISIDQHGTIFTWDLNGLAAWREATSMPAALEDVAASTPGPDLPVDERGQYLADARQGKLGRYGERSWALHLRTPPDRAPVQGGSDLVDAYRAAKRHAARFAEQLQQFGKAHGARVRIRPGSGIKDANRSVEKLLNKPGGLPTDLLGGTLIVDSMARMYELAERLEEAFEVVGFRDRMIYRVRSQYGDLQFSVMLEGHLAEVKVVHDLFQQIDRYEHRVYEIQRSLDAEFTDEDLPLAERFVGDALAMASRQMYTAAWEWITAREEGLDD